MAIKQLGGVFGRNPTFNDVTIEGQLTFDGDIDINSDLKIDGDLEVSGTSSLLGTAEGVLAGFADHYTRYRANDDYGVAVGMDASSNGGNGSLLLHGGVSKSIDFTVDTTGGFGAGTPAMTLSEAGNLTVATGNVIIATSGKGIDFSATAGTGTSELLDDYEEGVWTSEVGGTATYGDNTGRYTKVGRQVFATFDLNITTIGTGSTTVITGLPFAVGDAIAEGVSINFYAGLATNVVELNAYVINSEIRFRSMSAASSGLTDLAVLGDGCRVTGTAIYTV